MRVQLWDNKKDPDLVEANRPLTISRPCSCSTCRRGKKGVGLISGSVDGKGITIWLKTEEEYRRMKKVFAKAGIKEK